jgi:hypothetical protein
VNRFRDLLERIRQSTREVKEHTKLKDRRNATKARKQLGVMYGEISLLLYYHLEPSRNASSQGTLQRLMKSSNF